MQYVSVETTHNAKQYTTKSGVLKSSRACWLFIKEDWDVAAKDTEVTAPASKSSNHASSRN